MAKIVIDSAAYYEAWRGSEMIATRMGSSDEAKAACDAVSGAADGTDC